MVLHQGQTLFTWGDITRKSNLYSVRKSLLSALIGQAVDRGEIHLDATLAQLGIDDRQSLTDVEKQATVRDLLQSRSGIYHPSVYETPEMLAMKPARHRYRPGEAFVYNNWDFNALGTIYEKMTGLGIFAALDERIARPIGMQDYSPDDGFYINNPATQHRAYPLLLSTRDLARFAQLFAQDGHWQGKQIIPQAWVRQSTSPHSDADVGGYGYMWWTSASATGKPAPIAYPPGLFMAWGNKGQFAAIFPARQLVVVHRIDVNLTDKTVSKHQLPELLQLLDEAFG